MVGKQSGSGPRNLSVIIEVFVIIIGVSINRGSTVDVIIEIIIPLAHSTVPHHQHTHTPWRGLSPTSKPD